MSRVIRLNEDWLLADGNGKGTDTWLRDGLPREGAAHVDLPCFTHMALEDHTGVSFYEKTFMLDGLPEDTESAILCFEQADFRCEITVNGVPMGVHVGMEDPFSFNVTQALRAGENRITVRVSKPNEEPVDGYTFGEIPHRNQTVRGLRPGANYNESGICGEVVLRILPKTRIGDMALFADPETGEIRAEITLANDSGEAVDVTARLEVRRSPDGDVEDIVSVPLRAAPGDSEHPVTLRIENPALWSLKDPCLYLVRAEITTRFGAHSASKKTGFRTFRVNDDGYFTLNGERVYVRSSHTGNCFPESTHHIARDKELLRKDFLMAKAVGFNMIRFISGSALPLQLDLCDEIGLMVYEEPTDSWLGENGPHAAELYRDDLLTMVKRDRSHPCVTIWGLLNETFSKPPFDEVCLAARDALPELRRVDPTRLVLFSSGRWDKFDGIGSVSNPGHTDWQTLWGWEGDGLSPAGDLGDIHFYPTPVPMPEDQIRRIRSFGQGTPRPVFVSEIGIGSALDTVTLLRQFEGMGAIPFAPDVKMVRRMNDALMNEIRKFGFEDFVAFPSELMRGSMKNHAYYREQLFDLLRSNPNLCGLSLTGLLDHSICGEGLWTLLRQYKPMMADVLQDGFAPLRWCLLLSQPAVFTGAPLRVEGMLASEDALKPGTACEARAGIVGQDGKTYGTRTYRFTVTEEQARHMVIPVFDEEWDTAQLPEGEYTFLAELTAGGYASGGVRTFHVCGKAASRTDRDVCVSALTAEEVSLISSLGFKTHALEEGECGLIVAGHVDDGNREALERALQAGASVISLRAMDPDDQTLMLLPEERRPRPERAGDWLYHRETVLRPGGRFFRRMRTGLADARLYTGVLTYGALEAEGASIPDETDAFTFYTGCTCDSGFVGGFKLGSYRVGRGELIVNTFNLLDSVSAVPYAAQLLVNLLDAAGE